MPEITGSLKTTLWSWQQGVNREWETTITRQKSGLPQLPAKLNLIFKRVTTGLVWKQKPEHQGPGKPTMQMENKVHAPALKEEEGLEARMPWDTQGWRPQVPSRGLRALILQRCLGHCSCCTCGQGGTGKTAPHRHNNHILHTGTNCSWSGAFISCFT